MADIDWAAIELEYRAGVRTVRDIAASYGITHGAINKRAKRDEWERDLSAKVRAKAQALVSKHEVSKLVSKEQMDTEKAIINISAQVQADKIITHRTDIQKYRNLGNSLFNELEIQTKDIELFEKLSEIIDSGDNDRMIEVCRKVISTPGRIDSFKKLTDSVKTLFGLERQAFGISDNANGDADKPAETPMPIGDHLTSMIERINNATAK